MTRLRIAEALAASLAVLEEEEEVEEEEDEEEGGDDDDENVGDTAEGDHSLTTTRLLLGKSLLALHLRKGPVRLIVLVIQHKIASGKIF